MSTRLSYADAVKILGGDNKIVAALDKLTGGLLLATTGGGSEIALGLFDAKGELIRLSRELVAGLGDRMRGLSRFDRTERLTAAHSIIVIVAYFETLAEVDLPFDFAELELRKSEQVALAVSGPPRSENLRTLVEELLCSPIVPPAPQDGEELTRDVPRDFYELLNDRLAAFVAGLEIDGRARSRSAFLETVRNDVTPRAVRRYRELFRRLAADFPEVAFWASHLEREATRQEVHAVRTGLAGLGKVLDRIAAGRAPDQRRNALTRSHRAALARPLVDAEGTPRGLRIPELGTAYVNPLFRVASVRDYGRLHEESWWDEHKVRDDFQEFFIGYLTGPSAARVPLMVLGQPGSGKSVLTKVLAGRLPANDFLVVRVVLRDTPAEADLQTQIEYAIRDSTGESLPWPELARTVGDALPVVLLDGFDELLQATGVSQSDYLEKIIRFQERERDQGRPVAVMVTSRTAVADRARVPRGTVVVRLEPFSDDKVAQWLRVWNDTNAAYFTGRELHPLAPETALSQPELAAQPLLLLMLALYDADGNVLQHEGGDLSRAELYDRLLTRFAEREVRKHQPELDEDGTRVAVEEELRRLSVTAMAMFNRGRQWVTEAELSTDLTALLAETSGPYERGRSRSPLSTAQLVLGRFFFIHQARALRDETLLTTVEFLHATFGEFLVARLVLQELEDLATDMELIVKRTRKKAVDDGFLYAVLSFMPLSLREPTIESLRELAARMSPARRDVLRRLLIDWFRTALQPGWQGQYERYEPVPLSVPERCAAYSANLLLLALSLGGEIAGRELYPDSEDPVGEWRRSALLWRSQFSAEGWSTLLNAVDLSRLQHQERRDVLIKIVGRNHNVPPFVSLRWTSDTPAGSLWPEHEWSSALDLLRQSNFLCDAVDDIVGYAPDPFVNRSLSAFDGVLTATDSGGNTGETVSVAYVLIRLWTASGFAVEDESLAATYDACIWIFRIFEDRENAGLYAVFAALVLRQLAADASRLSREWRLRVVRKISYIPNHPHSAEWVKQAFGDLVDELPHGHLVRRRIAGRGPG